MLYELGIIIALIGANAFFSGAEIAVVALRKTRLEELLEHGQRGARSVTALRANPERFLATVQVGITVVGATAAAFGGSAIASRLSPLLSRVDWLAAKADRWALAIVIAIVSYLSIVVGELVPKSLALRSSERYALLVGKPLLALSWLARPLVWFLTASSNLILRPFGDRTTFTEARHSADELQQIVDEAVRVGSVDAQAGEIASRALVFPALTAADVMVPRQSVVMIPRHAPSDDIRRILLEHTHSRMPVYEDTIDNVVGYISIKDLLAVAWEGQLVIIEDVLRSAHFVPETKAAGDLLVEMRDRHNPFAIVVDNHGGTAGIVTMEDLLEELVGEIFSEHAQQEPNLIDVQADGSALVAGTTPIRDLNRALDLDLPEEGDWTTIGGMYIAQVGRIPSAGESMAMPDGTVLDVVDASPRQVRRLRISKAP